jgi:NIMA (never in mitosis gene a)-related kinase 2
VLQGEYQHLKEQVDAIVREAIGTRENELRIQVMKREEEVSAAMMRREEEIMEAVRMREAELGEAWRKREEEVREEVEERVQWVLKREEEIKVEAGRLEAAREELQKRVKGLGDDRKGEQSHRIPLP